MYILFLSVLIRSRPYNFISDSGGSLIINGLPFISEMERPVLGQPRYLFLIAPFQVNTKGGFPEHLLPLLAPFTASLHTVVKV